MNKEQKFHSALLHLRRNYSHGASTYGNCCVDNCKNNARGSGKCAEHLEAEIAEILGDKSLANKIHEGTRNVWMDIALALEMIEEKEGG